jgi:hypothetical protein
MGGFCNLMSAALAELEIAKAAKRVKNVFIALL